LAHFYRFLKIRTIKTRVQICLDILIEFLMTIFSEIMADGSSDVANMEICLSVTGKT